MNTHLQVNKEKQNSDHHINLEKTQQQKKHLITLKKDMILKMMTYQK